MLKIIEAIAPTGYAYALHSPSFTLGSRMLLFKARSSELKGRAIAFGSRMLLFKARSFVFLSRSSMFRG
ncbi:hypothetical protein [Nostoc sp.]